MPTPQHPSAGMMCLRWEFKVWLWEEETEYHDQFLQQIWPQERRFFDQCFSEERTKQWPTRLAEYWSHYRTEPGPLMEYLARRQRSLPSGRGPGSLHQKVDGLGLTCALQRMRMARIGTEFHGFLHLPREIRDMVYAHALVTDSRFIIANSDHEDCDPEDVFLNHDGDLYCRFTDKYEKDGEKRPLRGSVLPECTFPRPPALGPMHLLNGVSRTIQREAAEVFFPRNQLILTRGQTPHYPRGFYRPHDAGRLPVDYASLARDVSYAFDMRDCIVNDLDNLYRGELVHHQDIDSEKVPPAEAMLRLHKQKTIELEYEWVEVIDAIKHMTLDRLQLSFEECYCSYGCCRKVGWVLDSFIYNDIPPGRVEDDVFSVTDWTSRPPLLVEVIGWRSEKEKTMIQEKLNLMKGPNSMQFRMLEGLP